MRFSVLIESFFAVLRLWMIFATALRFLIDPLILPYSGDLHGFLLYKLKISLSKITDLLSHFTLVFGTENEGNVG